MYACTLALTTCVLLQLQRTSSRVPLPLSLSASSTIISTSASHARFLDNCIAAVGDTPHRVCLYARFDDLRAASASKNVFELALTTVIFALVDDHEYFGLDYTRPRAQAVSAYNSEQNILQQYTRSRLDNT